MLYPVTGTAPVIGASLGSFFGLPLRWARHNKTSVGFLFIERALPVLRPLPSSCWNLIFQLGALTDFDGEFMPKIRWSCIHNSRIAGICTCCVHPLSPSAPGYNRHDRPVLFDRSGKRLLPPSRIVGQLRNRRALACWAPTTRIRETLRATPSARKACLKFSSAWCQEVLPSKYRNSRFMLFLSQFIC